jgi:hypothetical protein
MAIKVKAFLIMRDGGDGSQSCQIVGSKQEAIKSLGYSSEEDMNKRWSNWYEDGGFSEIEIELEEKEGTFVISKGGFASTDDMDDLN